MQGVQLQQEERLFKQNLKAMDAARWLIPRFFATCFLFFFRTLADERKKLYEESMAEKRRRMETSTITTLTEKREMSRLEITSPSRMPPMSRDEVLRYLISTR